ncbi:24847_t:CDS:2, partial [Dentiscutata erythropus]
DIKEVKPSNRTFGFDHIYVINLNFRTDRRDRMRKLASYFDLDFDYLSAPSKYDSSFFRKYGFGGLSSGRRACFHSALILEDDVDFETNITEIMTDIHRNLPAYWDILYIVHCLEKIGKLVDNSSFANRLYESVMPSCTHAYAVSYWGARKLVEKLDPMIPQGPIDFAILTRIKNKEITSYSVFPVPITQWKGGYNPSDIPESSQGYQEWM